MNSSDYHARHFHRTQPAHVKRLPWASDLPAPSGDMAVFIGCIFAAVLCFFI